MTIRQVSGPMVIIRLEEPVKKRVLYLIGDVHQAIQDQTQCDLRVASLPIDQFLRNTIGTHASTTFHLVVEMPTGEEAMRMHEQDFYDSALIYMSRVRLLASSPLPSNVTVGRFDFRLDDPAIRSLLNTVQALTVGLPMRNYFMHLAYLLRSSLEAVLRTFPGSEWMAVIRSSADTQRDALWILDRLKRHGRTVSTLPSVIKGASIKEFRDLWERYQTINHDIMTQLACMSNLYLIQLLRRSTAQVTYVYMGVGHIPHVYLHYTMKEGYVTTQTNNPMLEEAVKGFQGRKYDIRSITKDHDDLIYLFGRWSPIDNPQQCSSLDEFPADLL